MLSENANQKREGGIAKFWNTGWLVRTMRTTSSFGLTVALALFADSAWAQLPDGPGKEETQRVCKNCHELERSVSRRQDRDGWQITLDKMETLGAEMTDDEYNAILDYLAKNYPAEEIPKLNANKATAIEFESRLTLTRSQASA